MWATEQLADELLDAVRGKSGTPPDLRIGVDVINMMLCKFYYNDKDPHLDIKGDISYEPVKAAIQKEDALTIDYFIKELTG